MSARPALATLLLLAAAGAGCPSRELPPPPAWVADLPMVGTQIAKQWTRLASSGPEGLGAHVAPYVRDIVQLLLGELERFGFLLLYFFLAAVLLERVATPWQAHRRT